MEELNVPLCPWCCRAPLAYRRCSNYYRVACPLNCGYKNTMTHDEMTDEWLKQQPKKH